MNYYQNPLTRKKFSFIKKLRGKKIKNKSNLELLRHKPPYKYENY